MPSAVAILTEASSARIALRTLLLAELPKSARPG